MLATTCRRQARARCGQKGAPRRRKSELVGSSEQCVQRKRRREPIGSEGGTKLQLPGDRQVRLDEVLTADAEEQRDVEGAEVTEGEEQRKVERSVQHELGAEGDAQLKPEGNLEPELSRGGG